MSDNETTTETTDTTTPTPPAPKPGPKSNELPDWAREQISSANAEAANFRVQLREEQKARKTLEDQVAALTAEKAGQVEIQSDFDRLVTAIQAEVPHDHIFAFAKTLKGSNAEELSAHAAELKSMFGISTGPQPAVDRSQGHGNPSNSDPAAEFAKLLQSNLTR